MRIFKDLKVKSNKKTTKVQFQDFVDFSAFQNSVYLLEPSANTWDISVKAGYKYMNQFCIDEDAAYESTGLYFLQESNFERFDDDLRNKKGTAYLLLYRRSKIITVVL